MFHKSNGKCLFTLIIYGRLSRVSYYSEICKAVVKLYVGFFLDLPSNLMHKNSLKLVIITRVNFALLLNKFSLFGNMFLPI